MSRSPRTVLVVMCAGYFLVLLDVTIVNVALPSIRSGLHTGVSGLQWVVDGYAIALASLMLGAGTLGDLRGHKRVVLIGLATFGIASLACGAAPTGGALIAARVAQGMGAALLLPGTLAIITHSFPERGAQARAIGVWAGVGSVALPAGPLLGGALIAAVGWRAVFLVNLPVVVLAFVVARRVVDESVDRRGQRLDVPGIALGALALASVTFTLVETGRTGLDAIAAGASIAAVAAFLLAERSREDPVLPLALLRRRDFTAANGVAAAMNLGTLGMLFVLTLYLQAVQGRSALAAGVAVIPLFLPLTVLAPLAGRLTARIGPRLPMVAGLLTAAAGMALLTAAGPHTSYMALLPALLLWGIGMGVLTPSVVAAAMASVPPDRAGLASATNNTARQAGGAIGIALLGAIAGDASHPSAFVGGLSSAALVTVGVWLLAAAVTLLCVPKRHHPGA